MKNDTQKPSERVRELLEASGIVKRQGRIFGGWLDIRRESWLSDGELAVALINAILQFLDEDAGFCDLEELVREPHARDSDGV